MDILDFKTCADSYSQVKSVIDRWKNMQYSKSESNSESMKFIIMTCNNNLAHFSLIAFLIFAVSCKEIAPKEKELLSVINKPVNIEVLNQVHQGDSVLLFSDIKQIFNYISIVYLKDGCSPCYPKFKEWTEKINLINPPENYAVLFVIHAESYEAFFTNKENFKPLNSNLFTTLDKENLFFISNSNIPAWIFDFSFLINAKNEIIMVGPPFYNDQFTAIFQRILNF